MEQRTLEEHVARELLDYFTGERQTGVIYEEQPQHVKDLWLGAACAVVKALQNFERIQDT
jgi:hypothetical protein